MKTYTKILLVVATAFVSSVGFAKHERVTPWDFSIDEYFLRFDHKPPSANLAQSDDLAARNNMWSQVQFNPAIEPAGTSVDLSNWIDFASLGALDVQAAETWNQWLQCSHGDAEKARVAYANHRGCAPGMASLKNLEQSVHAFLASTLVGKFDYIARAHCEQTNSPCSDALMWWNGGHPFDGDGMNSQFGHEMEFLQTAPQAQASFWKSIESIPAPQMHPLLVQELLEAIALGYPSMRGQKVPLMGRIPFLGGIIAMEGQSKSRMTLGATNGNWNPFRATFTASRDPNDPGSRVIQESTQQIVGEDLAPVSDVSPEIAQRVSLVRESIAALRILRLFGMGKIDCGTFGLWPDRSSELVDAISRMESGTYFNKNKDAAVVYLAFTRTCRPDLYPKNSYLTIIRPGDNFETDMDALGAVGAWRNLADK